MVFTHGRNATLRTGGSFVRGIEILCWGKTRFGLVLRSCLGLGKTQPFSRWIFVMRCTVVAFGMCLLAACTPVREDTPGEVLMRGGGEVIIVGPVERGKTAYPTARMIEQAQEVCPSARFVNASPSFSKPSSFDFLFRC